MRMHYLIKKKNQLKSEKQKQKQRASSKLFYA